MKMTIQAEQPFSILNTGFSLTPSAEGYVLQYSADGFVWTDYEDEVPANETLIVTGLPSLPLFFRLKGNASTLTLIY